MAAFVGELSSYKWFEWACEAGFCKPGDEVRRCILDIGIDDVVLVYIEKYADDEHAEIRLPEIQHVRRVEDGATRIVGVKDGFYVKELTPVGCELRDANAQIASLKRKLVRMGELLGEPSDG